MRDLLRKKYRKKNKKHVSSFVRETVPLNPSNKTKLLEIINAINDTWDAEKRLSFYVEKATEHIERYGICADNILKKGGFYTVANDGEIYTATLSLDEYIKNIEASNSETLHNNLVCALEASSKYQNELDLWYAAKIFEEVRGFRQSKCVNKSYCHLLNIGSYFQYMILIIIEPQYLAGKARMENARNKRSETKIKWEKKAITYYEKFSQLYPARKDTQHYKTIKNKLELEDNIVRGIPTIKRCIVNYKKK
jgi:hypothetical protein